MPLTLSEQLREVVAGLIYSPLYFSLAPAQRLSLVKSLASRPQLQPRLTHSPGPRVVRPRPAAWR